jgi:hypothetical protein
MAGTRAKQLRLTILFTFTIFAVLTSIAYVAGLLT